jgi:hypothetical protein
MKMTQSSAGAVLSLEQDQNAPHPQHFANPLNVVTDSFFVLQRGHIALPLVRTTPSRAKTSQISSPALVVATSVVAAVPVSE